MPTQAEKQAQNTIVLKKVISEIQTISYDSVSKIVPRMIVHGELTLDPTAYTPENTDGQQNPGRHLIYAHNDPANPFSIWAFSFAPQQKTCIHSHKYRGTVTVLHGTLTEKNYTLTDDNRALLSSREDRYRFNTTKDNLIATPASVHQLKYRKGIAQPNTFTVSLHIYEMPALEMNSTNHNRNLFSIFQKKQGVEKKPPYNSLRSKL